MFLRLPVCCYWLQRGVFQANLVCVDSTLNVTLELARWFCFIGVDNTKNFPCSVMWIGCFMYLVYFFLSELRSFDSGDVPLRHQHKMWLRYHWSDATNTALENTLPTWTPIMQCLCGHRVWISVTSLLLFLLQSNRTSQKHVLYLARCEVPKTNRYVIVVLVPRFTMKLLNPTSVYLHVLTKAFFRTTSGQKLFCLISLTFFSQIPNRSCIFDDEVR